VAGDLHHPFRVVELAGRDGWAQLGSEMAALSMIGPGRAKLAHGADRTLTDQPRQEGE
jgi:hypothetical protein